MLCFHLPESYFAENGSPVSDGGWRGFCLEQGDDSLDMGVDDAEYMLIFFVGSAHGIYNGAFAGSFPGPGAKKKNLFAKPRKKGRYEFFMNGFHA